MNWGDRVTLHVVSEDVAHGLYIDGYDINLHAVPHEGAEEATVTFTADRPGTFQFRCSVVCASMQAHHAMKDAEHMPELTHHFQMTGKLVVET